ncbi:MAG: sulfotransferase domain-containing protein [Myxococcales bacterium]|nr:sulfotransferase domain-containing protein [Myxococcales bacterium]
MTAVTSLKTLKTKAISWLGATGPGREALEWWIHRQTAIYVLSYPKCGRTWLRLMIGKALDEHYQLHAKNPMELGRMHALHRAIPRIRVTHEHAHKAATIEGGKQRFRDKTVVFLVRDPRDVVVSMFFEASRRTDRFAGTIGEFIRQDVGGLDAILDYYNVWAEAARVPRTFHLVRYEDLHRAPGPVLAGVLAAMQLPVSPAAIDAAIGFSKFDNMRKLETENAFGSDRLRPANAGDAESFKTRKGKIGGYREYLTAADLAYVHARIAARLSPAYPAYQHADAPEARA